VHDERTKPQWAGPYVGERPDLSYFTLLSRLSGSARNASISCSRSASSCLNLRCPAATPAEIALTFGVTSRTAAISLSCPSASSAATARYWFSFRGMDGCGVDRDYPVSVEPHALQLRTVESADLVASQSLSLSTLGAAITVSRAGCRCLGPFPARRPAPRQWWRSLRLRSTRRRRLLLRQVITRRSTPSRLYGSPRARVAGTADQSLSTSHHPLGRV
jgi:hypothetical protein